MAKFRCLTMRLPISVYKSPKGNEYQFYIQDVLTEINDADDVAYFEKLPYFERVDLTTKKVVEQIVEKAEEITGLKGKRVR